MEITIEKKNTAEYVGWRLQSARVTVRCFNKVVREASQGMFERELTYKGPEAGCWLVSKTDGQK